MGITTIDYKGDDYMFVKVVSILALILVTLYSFKFIVEVITDTNRRKTISSIAHLFLVFMCSLWYVDIIIKNYDEIDGLQNSIIFGFFTIHILLTVVICSILSMSIIFIYFIFDTIKEGVKPSINMIKEIGHTINEVNKKDIISSVWNRINKAFNPLYNINIKIDPNRLIKIMILVAYLLAGIILLSPMTCLYEKDLINIAGESYFNRDYELYKQVFITSLIPFILGYIINGKKKNNE